jgi:hypothetical protein
MAGIYHTKTPVLMLCLTKVEYSIYLSGGNDKDLSRKYLGMAVSQLARTSKAGGIVFYVTAACTDAI